MGQFYRDTIAATRFLIGDRESNVSIAFCEGVPDNGPDGTGAAVMDRGSIVIDRTNGVIYVNTGTAASPVWEASGTVGANSVDTAAIRDGAVTEDKLADGAVTGAVVKGVADADPVGAVPVLFCLEVGGAAGHVDVTVAHKLRVVDVWAVHTAAGETDDTIQVFAGAAAVTDAMDWSGADKTVVRAGSIDAAAHEIDAGGTLRVTTTDKDGGDDVGSGLVYVLCVRVPDAA